MQETRSNISILPETRKNGCRFTLLLMDHFENEYLFIEKSNISMVMDLKNSKSAKETDVQNIILVCH